MSALTHPPLAKGGQGGVLLFVCLLCSVFSGCGGAAPGGEDGVVLTVWETYNNEEHDVFVRLAKDFQPMAEREFGVKVRLNIQRVPFDGLLSKLKTAALTHTTPDICRVDVGDMPTLAFGKALLTLDEVDDFEDRGPDGRPDLEAFRKKFVAAAIGSNIITIGKETHLYGMPDQTTCVALYWNRKLFRDNAARLTAVGLNPTTPPRTWDEFIRYGVALTDTGRQQYGFGMDNSLWWSFPFFNTYAAPFFTSEDGQWKFHLAEDSGQQALQLKVDLYRKYGLEAGAWQPGAIGPDQGFMNGKYAMILSGPWRLETFRQAKVDYDVTLIPAGPAGTSTNVGGTNMVIFRKTRHPRISFAFLKFISSKDFQVRWSRELNQIPVRLDAIAEVAPLAHPNLRVFMEQMKTAKARPPVPNYGMLETIVVAEMELALKGVKTVPEALKSASEMVEKKILVQLNAPSF